MATKSSSAATLSGTAGFLEPERIVQYFNLKPGDHVADFGAGHGYFTIPMARLVGGDGKVYALDIQKPVLDIIRSRAKVEHLLNIETIWADLEEPGGSKLKDKFIDLVVVSNILFQVEKKNEVLREAYRILREQGRLAIIEWEAASSGKSPKYQVGPPPALRIKKEVAKDLALQAGFELDREFEAGSYHYGLLFKKP